MDQRLGRTGRCSVERRGRVAREGVVVGGDGFCPGVLGEGWQCFGALLARLAPNRILRHRDAGAQSMSSYLLYMAVWPSIALLIITT